MKNIILVMCLLSLAGCMKSENSNQFRHNLKQVLSGATAQIQRQQQEQSEFYKAHPLHSGNKTTHCTTQYSGNMAYTNCN